MSNLTILLATGQDSGRLQQIWQTRVIISAKEIWPPRKYKSVVHCPSVSHKIHLVDGRQHSKRKEPHRNTSPQCMELGQIFLMTLTSILYTLIIWQGCTVSHIKHVLLQSSTREVFTEKLFGKAVQHGSGLAILLSVLLSVENAHIVNKFNWDA